MAASVCSNLFNRAPIIVVLGATGTGKSKLAIELALKFNGEVISADSMQVYRGLDIATNKVTEEEQRGIRHHLLGFLDPRNKLLVTDFRNMALKTIGEILDRDKVPIIVGGTNYYIESVLYNVLVNDPSTKCPIAPLETDEPSSKRLKPDHGDKDFWATVDGQTNQALHERLRQLDPDTAEVVHPNNRRKIVRGLQVLHQTGEKLSEVLKRQRSQPGGSRIGGPLRFSNAIILWLQCESEVLKKRLDARVDAMISQGLVEELLDFKTKCGNNDVLNDSSPDFTTGVLQTIGFKEFHEYLSCEESLRDTEEGIKLLQTGIESLKLATRQYAKRQNRWIQNRFLRSTGRKVPPIYALDATDLSKWETRVHERAVHLVECHLAGRKPLFDPLPSVVEQAPDLKCYPCDVCNIVVIGENQWRSHVKGNKHRVVLRKLEKGQKTEESKRPVEETCEESPREKSDSKKVS